MSAAEFLKNVWYFASPSSEIQKEKLKSIKIVGLPIVLCRDKTGKVYALRDICPHRGIPLSYGKMVNGELECPYHGWRFDHQGQCTTIPSLCADQKLDVTKIRVSHYPIEEVQGNIWIFIGSKEFDLSKAPPIPLMPFFKKDKQPNFMKKAIFPCHVDQAVIGLMDPAHGPFVHTSWFWRTQKSIYEKSKQFAPVPFGFQMVRHQPSKNSRAYAVLGGAPSTEITFHLPCVRIEHVQVGEKSFCSFTALTPVDEKTTLIHQMGYWDIPWLTLLKPLITQFADVFLGQDMDAVTKQQEGLKYEPTLMLINDADAQAKWYYRLKSEWSAALIENRDFKNPIQPTLLRWRS